jgi:hypothetical protein
LGRAVSKPAGRDGTRLRCRCGCSADTSPCSGGSELHCQAPANRCSRRFTRMGSALFIKPASNGRAVARILGGIGECQAVR